MATSPDYVRLATHATRALAETALDGLVHAVLVVDARHRHLPIVLSNSIARRSIANGMSASDMIETVLAKYLDADSARYLESTLFALSETKGSAAHRLSWRFSHEDRLLNTEITPLNAASGQRLVMLSFSPVVTQPNSSEALDQVELEVLILDSSFKVTYANAAARAANATLADEIVGSPAQTLMPTSALSPGVYTNALDGIRYQNEAVEVTMPGSPSRWFKVGLQRLNSKTGAAGLMVMSLEITQRHWAAMAESSSERRLLALTEHARDIISVAHTDGRLQYVSGGLRNSLGWTSEERVSNYLFEHIHVDDRQGLVENFQQLVEGEIAGFLKEVRIRHKDGSYRWLESNYVSALNNPLINGVVINSRDVTERKQAELRLAQREEVFRLAADAVDGVIFEWDVTRGVVHRSRGVMEILGVSPEDFEPTMDAWLSRVHPRDFGPMRKTVGLALINGRGWTTSYRIRDARGRYRSMLERGVIQRNAAGDPVRAIGCCVDVSEIKRLTDILAETQRIAKIGGWEYSYATRELTWTEEMYRIYATDAQSFDVSWEAMVAQCAPESAQRLRSAFVQAENAGSHIDLELEIHTLARQRIWVRIIGHLELLDGRPFRAYGSLQNIQAQKGAQVALEQSTGWLKLSMNMAHMHAWRWDKARDCFEFATLEGKQVNLPSVFPSMDKILMHMHPQDRDAVRRAIDEALLKHIEVREEFRLQAKDGRYRFYATTARPLYDAENAACGLVGVIQDITARRESERRLRQSEELLQATTANTADTLFLVDTSLRVRFINRSVDELSIEKIIGSEIEVLLPVAARPMVLAKLRHILRTGETATYEFDALRSGQRYYYENRAVLVQDDGIGTGISISMRDITERKRLEQEILDVSSRERQSIGRDLHDGLGQELTGVALMLRGLAMRIEKRCPDVVENVNEVVGLVNQSIETARSLARGLMPVRNESGGLAFALRTLAARSRDLYGADVTFRVKGSPEQVFSETNASHLYRITQEALTNAARHGHALEVDILLSVYEEGFTLKITDNGSGFTPPALSANGMGLKTMKYRADMIGAKFEIRANKPHGTVVKIKGARPAPITQLSITAFSGDPK